MDLIMNEAGIVEKTWKEKFRPDTDMVRTSVYFKQPIQEHFDGQNNKKGFLCLETAHKCMQLIVLHARHEKTNRAKVLFEKRWNEWDRKEYEEALKIIKLNQDILFKEELIPDMQKKIYRTFIEFKFQESDPFSTSKFNAVTALSKINITRSKDEDELCQRNRLKEEESD